MDFLSQYPFLITVFPVGLVFWILGFYFVNHPPKKINPLMGYRTPRSMKNQESWDFAQIYSSELFKKYGALMMFVSFLDFFMPAIGAGTKVSLGIAAVIIPIAYMIYQTERTLKEKFGDKK